MDKWHNKVAVVTGASAGIGAAIVEKLVEEGMVVGLSESLNTLQVVGIARRVDRMEEDARRLIGKIGSYHPMKCDVANEQELLETFKNIKENIGPIYVLINNAGHAKIANLIDGNTELWRDMLNVNVLALCVASREAIKNMRDNNIDGHIIHINSVFGHTVERAFPLNMYGATKFAVTALTEALRNELLAVGSRIKVTSISPGITMTEIFDAGGLSYDICKENVGGKLPYIMPSDVANAVVYVLSTPPNVRVSELTIKSVDEEM